MTTEAGTKEMMAMIAKEFNKILPAGQTSNSWTEMTKL